MAEQSNYTKNPFRTFWIQIKKILTIQIAYPMDFFGQIFTSLFVGVWFIMFAVSVTSGDDAITKGNVNYIGIAVWGFVAFLFFSTTMFSIGRFIRREQLTGTLESLWLTSANKTWLIIANGTGYFFIYLISNIIIVLGFSLFVTVPIENIGLGMLIILLELIQVVGFGFLYGALVMKIKNAAAIQNLFTFATMILCAVLFPFSVFPEGMKWVSRLIPFSWIIDAFRSTMSGYEPELLYSGIFGLSPLLTEILIIIGFNIILLFIGIFLFNRVTKKAMIEGTLSQY